MPFDWERFMAYEPTEADRARARAEWRGIIVGMESARVWDAMMARLPKKRQPRKGSKAHAFLQLLTANPELPAARINAMLPEPMDESTARRLAREWRGFE
jgi:hypothetical protein